MVVAMRRAEPSDLEVPVELAAVYCAADGHDFVESTVRSGFEPMLGKDDHGTVWMIDETVSDRAEVRDARQAMDAGKKAKRLV